jgi:SPOR domain
MLFKGANILLFLVMAILTVSFVIIWLGFPDHDPAVIQISDVDLPEPHQTGATGSMATDKLKSRKTGTINPIDVYPEWIATWPQDTTVNDAATSIEPADRQAMDEAAQISEALPPPAAGQAVKEPNIAKTDRQAYDAIETRHQDTTVNDAATSIEPHAPGKPDRIVSLPPALPASGAATVEGGQSSIRKPLNTATSQASVRDSHESATNQHPAASRDNYGPWVINLISTTSKAEADRFAEKARSRELQTVQQQITLKGTQHWRVQITGFSTAEDARVYAESAKERLGLKDVWIMKH